MGAEDLCWFRAHRGPLLPTVVQALAAWHQAGAAQLPPEQMRGARPPARPSLIYCVRALFAAIKLSRNGNMFLFSHICRMKVNIFIILPSSPHSRSLALNMWA